MEVRLSEPPGRPVEVPLTVTHKGADGGDLSGVPPSVTFGANETSSTFDVVAVDDAVDDDLESVTLGFGTLPAGVSAGRLPEAVVNLEDNDGGLVDADARLRRGELGDERGARGHHLQPGDDARRGARGAGDGSRSRSSTPAGRAAADIAGLPATVKFGARKRRANVLVRMVDDTDIDPGEGFRVTFGTLPAGVKVDERYSVATSPSSTTTASPRCASPTRGRRAVVAGSAESWLEFRVTLSERYAGPG